MAAAVQLAVQLLGQHLHTLILLFWGLAGFASTVALLPLPGVDWFRSAVALAACRGKLLDDPAAPRTALGRLSGWAVPQAWFAHFYALGAAWNACVAWLLLGSPHWAALAPAQQAGAVLALGLLQLHLSRRLAETVGLLRYPPGARMHGLAYVFGMRCGAGCQGRAGGQAWVAGGGGAWTGWLVHAHGMHAGLRVGKCAMPCLNPFYHPPFTHHPNPATTCSCRCRCCRPAHTRRCWRQQRTLGRCWRHPHRACRPCAGCWSS